MKLVSFSVSTPIGSHLRVGAVAPDGRYVDLEAAYRACLASQGLTPSAAARISAAVLPSDMVEFIEGGDTAQKAAHAASAWAQQHNTGLDGNPVLFRPADVILHAPVPRAPLLRDFMAFETHLKNIYPKLGRDIPSEWYEMPVYYKGNPSSVGGHGADVPMPSYADELDYEFELAIVIGTSGINIRREEALDHIFGFMIYNDFSARDIQSREMSVGLGPAKGKDFHNAHVFGPHLVTVDEVQDPYNMQMVSRVNGQERCNDSSGSIHWKFEDMIVHASWNEKIEVGEIFGTGTVGNGSGAELDEFLKPGDTVELEVEGLGTLRNQVV